MMITRSIRALNEYQMRIILEELQLIDYRTAAEKFSKTQDYGKTAAGLTDCELRPTRLGRRSAAAAVDKFSHQQRN